MPHILVVCTANVCRSPVAEALIGEKIARNQLSDWSVSSAGTWAMGPPTASAYSVQCMAERGLDIRDHRARKVDDALLEKADLVLCMELGHVEALQVEFPRHREKIMPITGLVGGRYSIRDPYGGPKREYDRMVAQLAEIIDAGWPRIQELAAGEEG